MISFKDIKATKIEKFKGGNGIITTQMFMDENTKIMKSVLNKGVSIGLHTHTDSCEIIYVLQGDATCLINGEIEIVNEGNCHYCPVGSTHMVENKNDKPLVLFCVVSNHPEKII